MIQKIDINKKKIYKIYTVEFILKTIFFFYKKEIDGNISKFINDRKTNNNKKMLLRDHS